MKKYISIAKHYEDCFLQHGDNHKGMDWPNKKDLESRFEIMLGVAFKDKSLEKNSLLDFGCGTSLLLEYLMQKKEYSFDYTGLDISEKFINVAKQKFPKTPFYCLNILEEELDSSFNYIVMNGVFTEKRSLSHDEMFNYFKKMIQKVFLKTNKGLAFNVMSKHVDWEREDLFHLSIDTLTQFLCKEVTRNFIIRNDYGLYEYTVYLYK